MGTLSKFSSAPLLSILMKRIRNKHLRMIHFTDPNNENCDDSGRKLCYFLETLISNWNYNHTFKEYLAKDEYFSLWKGELNFTIYIRTKRERCCVKIFISLRKKLVICWISLPTLEKLPTLAIWQPQSYIKSCLKIAPFVIWIKDIMWHGKCLQVSWNCQVIALNKTNSSTKNKVHELGSRADQGFLAVSCQKVLAASVSPAEYWLNSF